MDIFSFNLVGVLIPGCFQQEKSEPSIGVASDSIPEENLPDTTGGDNDSDTTDSSEQNEEPTEVQFIFYPSGRDFIKSVIDKRGSVEITDEMREGFNLFAQDYRWCCRIWMATSHSLIQPTTLIPLAIQILLMRFFMCCSI